MHGGEIIAFRAVRPNHEKSNGDSIPLFLRIKPIVSIHFCRARNVNGISQRQSGCGGAPHGKPAAEQYQRQQQRNSSFTLFLITHTYRLLIASRLHYRVPVKYRMMITAVWARVALPRGFNVVGVVP